MIRQLLHEGKIVSEIDDNYQTRLRGTNDSEYQIYLDLTDDKFPKTYDEWLDS